MATSSATLNMIMKAQDKASGVLGRVAGSLGRVAAVAGGVVVAGLTAATVAAGKLAMDAAALPAIAEGFERNMEKYGLSAEDMEKRLAAASAGTVSSFEMMRKANLALSGAGEQLGHEFGEKLPQLMEIARAAARDTGRDVDFLFESLVTGIKRGAPLLIDNTGLVLKVGEATEAYAAEIGKSVEELTAQERSIAILNATMKAGEVLMAGMNMEQKNAAELSPAALKGFYWATSSATRSPTSLVE